MLVKKMDNNTGKCFVVNAEDDWGIIQGALD